MVQHFQHSNPFMDLVRASLLIAINTIIFFSTKISYAQIIEDSFEFEGKTRDYIIFLPQNFQPNMPVVFNLHGYTDNAQWQMDYTDMNSVADTTGFIVVYPNAIYPGFNTGLYMSGWPPLPNENDVGFISNLIDTIHINYGIDLSRVYVCGFSNGAIMTFKLACKLSHRFAAGASVGGVMLDSIVNNCYQSVTFPMLICNGTSDALIPYYGNHKQGKWSVNETVDFWVENNGCVLEADTVSLPNTDPTDGCTIDKISYMNCEDSTEVVFYKVIGGGHSWPSGTKTGSWAGNTNRDINANVELWNFFKDYENPYADLDENPYADLAYAKSMEISHKYKNIPLQGDTLVVNAYLSNPKNHQVEVYAIIKADGGDYKDSIKLFDDGLHNDGNVSDNFYSGYKWLSNLEEDFYTVELFTNDIDMEKTKRFYFNEHFTTAGPIEIDTFSFQISRDSLLTVKNFKITNKSTVKTVKNVKVEIKTSDTTVSEIIKNSADFGDIAAGDSKTVSTAFNLYIDKNADPDSIKFEFEISSNGIVYWVIAPNQILIPPSAPLLIEPENDTTLDSVDVQFVWHQSNPDVEKYWLELDTTNQFVVPIFIDSTIADTTLLYSSFQSNKNYWWRVKAYNSLGWSSFSEVRTFDMIITSVEDDNQLPAKFCLEQNFPNPFNPSTIIKYSIPELSFVTIKIYDVLGNEISTIVNTEKPAGNYEVEFNDNNFSSGVYFYQIKAGNFIETKKMVLLK